MCELHNILRYLIWEISSNQVWKSFLSIDQPFNLGGKDNPPSIREGMGEGDPTRMSFDQQFFIKFF
jgi:hypothetical protein